MTENKQRLESLVFVLCLLLVALIASRIPLDTDMWWHLKAGENTVVTGIPTVSDTMSFTKGGEKWVNHSWLAQIPLYLSYKLAGYWGLEGYVVLLAMMCMVFLWLQLTGNPLLKAALILSGFFLISMVLSPRPQLFSLFFLAFLSWYLNVYLKQNYKHAWGLPILFLIWSNIHAGAVLGVLYLGTFTAASFISLLINKIKPKSWTNIWFLAGWAFASLCAIAVNPNGLAIYGISVVTVQVQVQQYIQEWLPPDIHEPLQLFFYIFLMINFMLLLIDRKKVTLQEFALVLIFAYFALTGRRNIAPFSVVAIPVVFKHLLNVISNIFRNKSTSEKKQLNPGITRAINLSLFGFVGLVVLLKFYFNGHPANVKPQIEAFYPTNQIAMMLNVKPQDNLLNEYNWGGYLAWSQLEYPVMIDARTDLYGDAIFLDWYALITADTNWRELINKYNIGVVMLYTDRPLVNVLKQDGWTVLQSDEVGILLAR